MPACQRGWRIIGWHGFLMWVSITRDAYWTLLNELMKISMVHAPLNFMIKGASCTSTVIILFTHSVMSDFFVTPWTFSSVYGIFQARTLEQVPSPGDLPYPGIKPTSPAWQVDSLPLSHQGSPRPLYTVPNTYWMCAAPAGVWPWARWLPVTEDIPKVSPSPQ